MSAISRKLCINIPKTTSFLCKRLINSGTNMKLVLTERMGNIFLVAINRPENRNCVNPQTANDLSEAFKQFEKDKELKVAVLYGKGGNFCAGFDLKALSKLDDNYTVPDLDSGFGPMVNN